MMHDIQSCYCFGANMCADCSKIVKWDPVEDSYSRRDDEQVDDIACLSYSRGFFAGVKPGTQVCWMVDPSGPECPDAEDNSLAGSIALGKEFPTGNLHPLAHAGCRCLLAPVQQ
jgi:hypothetical protein